MVKLVIKHFIYEQCIDMFYGEVYNNFVKPRINSALLNDVLNSFNQLMRNKLIQNYETRIGADGKIIVDIKLTSVVDWIDLSGVIESIKKNRQEPTDD